jgi:hypothetical protein
MRKSRLKYTYSQRSGIDANEKATIFCRVTYGRELDFRSSTELKIEPKLFNVAKGRCEFQQQLLEAFDDPIHGQNLRAMIDLTIDEKLDFIE